MRHKLSILIVLMGLFYIFGIPDTPEPLNLLFKIIPIALMMALALRAPVSLYRHLVLIGLGICMIGDLTIRWFVVGLSAFLIGHLFYIFAFIKRWRFSWLSLSSIIGLLAYMLWLGARLISAISINHPELQISIVFYMSIIGLMCFTAIMTRQPMAIAGAILFVISDSILAWNQFVETLPFATALVMSTYYTAQFLIMSSVYRHEAQALALKKVRALGV
ncbi:MAG: lysoplasmalogenase [Myxococcales bacterium]|nr:lysoplasmalogenase [Myxococcales bacterium]